MATHQAERTAVIEAPKGKTNRGHGLSPRKDSIIGPRMVEWLAKRSLQEKVTAVVLWELLSCESEGLLDRVYDGGAIANDTFNLWERDIEADMARLDSHTREMLEIIDLVKLKY